jgi:hypothetical protein
MSRRTIFEFKKEQTPADKVKQLLKSPPIRVKCYVMGIENGPRREIYPDGHIVNYEYPRKSETQGLLHG